MIGIRDIVYDYIIEGYSFLCKEKQVQFYNRYFELVKDKLLEGEIVEFPIKGGKIAIYRREQKKLKPKKPSVSLINGVKKVSWHDQINRKRFGWYYGTFWRHNRAHYLGYLFSAKGKLKRELAKKLKETDIEYRAYVNKKVTVNQSPSI